MSHFAEAKHTRAVVLIDSRVIGYESLIAGLDPYKGLIWAAVARLKINTHAHH
jgi:hypothetical protein